MTYFITDIIVVCLAIFLGTLVLATAGFGIAIVSSPLLLITLDPQSAVIIINTVSLIVFIMLIYQNKKFINYKTMCLPTCFGLLAVPLGIYLFSNSDMSTLKILISILIILMAVLLVYKINLSFMQHPLTLWLSGFIVSTLITVTGIGGPIIAIVVLHKSWDRNTIRGSLAFYYFFINLAAVIGYGISGMLTFERITLSAVALLPTVISFTIASLLIKKIAQNHYNKLIFVIIFVSGFVILINEVRLLF